MYIYIYLYVDIYIYIYIEQDIYILLSLCVYMYMYVYVTLYVQFHVLLANIILVVLGHVPHALLLKQQVQEGHKHRLHVHVLQDTQAHQMSTWYV